MSSTEEMEVDDPTDQQQDPNNNRGKKRKRKDKSNIAKLKKEIADKILLGEYESVTKEEVQESGIATGHDWRSPVWEEFLLVRQVQSKELTEGVQCKACRKIYIYRGHTTGVSSMGRHLRRCVARKEKKASDHDATVRKDPPDSAKNAFTEAAAHYCARDLRAPRSMESPGMEKLIKTTVDLTVKHGAMHAKKLIPSARAITRIIHKEAEKATSDLSEEVLVYIRKGRCAATTDAMTESHNQEKYFCVTVHYIDENWKLNDRVAFTINIETDTSSENVRSFLLEQLESKLHIRPTDATKIIFVTDGGSDIVKALEDGGFKRIYCVGHSLNVIVHSTLCCKYYEIILSILEAFPRVNEIVQCCNGWIDEVRKLLPKKYENIREQLHKSNPTPQSHVPMLQGVLRCRQKVEKVLKDAPTSLIGINSVEIKELIEFLSPFDSGASREKSTNVTSARVPYLQEHLQLTESDATAELDIGALKAHAMSEIIIMDAVSAIESCKAVVTYLKRAGLNKFLESSAKQGVETRWSSDRDMMQSVHKQWDEIDEVLQSAKKKKGKDKEARGKVPSLSNVNRALVGALIDFLEPFAQFTTKLQGRRYPTLQYVLTTRKVLLLHTSVNIEDCPVIAAVRARAHRLILKKILIADEHKLATLFWPRMKELTVFDKESERKEVHDLVRVRLQAIAADERQAASRAEAGSGEASTSSSSTSVSTTRGCTDEDLYGMLMMKKSAETNELERYLLMPESEIGDDSCLLQWWKTQGAARFPKLTKIALTVLHIPATSAASESGFSDTGRLISDLRTNLLPTTVNDTLVLRNHLLNQERK